MPYRSLADTIGYLRFPPADEDRPAWAVVEDGSLCGFAAVRRVRGAATAWLELRVHPTQRRRGVGTALVAAARSYAAASDVGVLLGYYVGTAAAAFCRAAGAEEGQRDVSSTLRFGKKLPVPTPVPGYRLVRWTGACPDGLLASYADARAAINDAPHDDADATWSPERVRGLEAVVARRGRETRVTAVVSDSETVVAFTEMRISPAPSSTVSIEDTAVVRQHRQRGLATWMKADALATLRLERPDVAFVTTSNAYENHPIRAINQRLGFTSTVVWVTAVLTV